MPDTTLDRNWAKRAFLVPDSVLESEVDTANRYLSSASVKFTDSRLGGNIGINSRYQFTRYSDIRNNGRLAGRNEVKIESATGDHGLGRYMSEVYDDNTRVIYLQFGVPKFNSLFNFFRRAMDYESAIMVRSGRSPTLFYSAGKLAGTIGLLVTAPVLVSAGLVMGKAAGWTSELLWGRPNSKFYTLKPTMTHYWSTVHTLVQILSINKDLIPAVFKDTILDGSQTRKINQPVQMDEGYMKATRDMYPELFNEFGFIDVYSVANRAQRLANRVFVEEYDSDDLADVSDFTGAIKDEIYGSETRSTKKLNRDGSTNIMAAINRMVKFPELWNNQPSINGSESNLEATEMDSSFGVDDTEEEKQKKRGFFSKYFEELNSLYSDGAEFAVFRVEETGSVTDSFSNSVSESDLSNTINNMSSSGRQARFAFADGNLIDGAGTVVGDTISTIAKVVTDRVADVAAGTLESLTLGMSNIPLLLSGLGYIDIPKNWTSSSTNLARLTYTMDLVSPYNNALSHMQDIYIPLCMILAGGLPRSTGEMSYGSPFICQLYDRGRVQIKTGMIESISVERGITTLPFSKRGEALGVRVSFSIVDLSSIMHVPVSSGGILGRNNIIGENSVIADYLAVLAGMDLASQIYPMSQARLNVLRRIAISSKFSSPAFYAMHVRDLSKRAKIGYVLEAMGKGSELTYGGMGKS